MMFFNYKDKDYEVEVVIKNNKNTYIRARDGKLYVMTNRFTSKRMIRKILKDNYSAIGKMIDIELERKQMDEQFRLFGKIYEIRYDNIDVPVIVKDNVILAKGPKEFDAWLKEYVINIFSSHLIDWYNKFEEDIPKPNLKIKKMRSRWGSCNIINYNVTLNLELLKYDIECLDYVIVHELSHFIEGNHSKNFWAVVEKYYPNYKEIKKKLKY